MTAAAHSRAGTRARAAAEAPRINWSMVGVCLTLVMNLIAGVWMASGLDRRVASLEAAMPPGALQRLDERTLQMSKALERLESRP